MHVCISKYYFHEAECSLYFFNSITYIYIDSVCIDVYI